MRLYVYLSLTICLILISCGKEQQLHNDSCQGVTPFKTGFTIQQEVGDTVYTSDTVFLHSYIHLVPNSLTGTVQWRIPSTGLTNSNLVFRLFLNDGLNTSVPVSLNQTYIPHPSCFAGETGNYTSSNAFFITDYSESFVKGKFQGSIKGFETDTFTICIRYFPSPAPNYFLSNLPKGCTRSVYTGYPSGIGYNINAGYRFFTFDGTTCLPNVVKGQGFIVGNDSIIIHYWEPDLSNSTIKRMQTFLGKRIQ